MPTNHPEKKNPKKEMKYTAKEMAEHKASIKLICSELCVLPIYGKKQVYTVVCQLLGITPETHKKRDQFETGPPNVPNAPEVAQPPVPAKLKWQKTEIGKALKITSHITSTSDGNTERSKEILKEWLNVGGAAGAAIKRGFTKGRDTPTIIAEINGVDLTDASPTKVVESLGKLFQDPSYVPPTKAQREERRRLAKEAKEKTKLESKDTSAGKAPA